MIDPMALDIWDGDWGLPSIDISCLQILVYCKFTRVPLDIEVVDNPCGRILPTFTHENMKLHNLEDVIDYLRGEGVDLDSTLTRKNSSDVQAFTYLLKEKLYPAIQFMWWVDTKNYLSLTRPWYAKKIRFPYNFYYPGHYESRARALISSLYGSLEENFTAVQSRVYRDAERCLTLLSNKLGESRYFFGSQPSSLDAVVFSYLAPLLRAPFQNQAIQSHLKACTNLVSFVNNITDKYYSALAYEYAKKRLEREKILHEGTFKDSVKRQILALGIAMAAMFGYMALAPIYTKRSFSLDHIFTEPDEELD